jgi:ZIP family zinc transporter
VALAEVLLWSTAAALATPLGGLAALGIHRTRGGVREIALRLLVAVGGGLLLAAVALVLVPEGLARVGLLAASAWLLAGAALVLVLDKAIERRGRHDSQALGAAVDSVPESVALGAAFAAGAPVGFVLAALVALQNLPQGFNGFLEMRGPHGRPGRALGTLAWTSLLGPLGAAAGYLFLGPYPSAVAALFLASAGGLLYLVVQDVAPLAHKDGHWLPAFGAVVGFVLGLACTKLAS